MFNQWLRTNKVVAVLLVFVRFYLGYTWISGGIHKLSGGFDAGGFLQGAITKSTGWWAVFLEQVALPGVNTFNILIPLGETFVGLGLILGIFTTFSALMAIVMNSAFLLSGSLSINVQMLLLECIIIVAAANGGRIGLDRWVLPYISSLFNKKAKTSSQVPHLNTTV